MIAMSRNRQSSLVARISSAFARKSGPCSGLVGTVEDGWSEDLLVLEGAEG